MGQANVIGLTLIESIFSGMKREAAHMRVGHASHYMRQLLEAISYCHHHGIIHCNLQPQFVVVASAGNSSPIKLTGFTIARQLGLSDVVHAGLSLTSLVCCTPFPSSRQLSLIHI